MVRLRLPPAESHQRTELGEFHPREGGFPNGQLTQLWERPFDRPGVGRDDPIVRRWSDAALTSRSASSCSAGGSVTATDAAISSLARAVLALQVALASNP